MINTWASSQENLSTGFTTNRVSNQAPQLQRLASELKFRYSKFTYGTFQKVNNKGADQTVRMRRLVCACVVCKPPKKGFLATRPIYSKTCLNHPLKNKIKNWFSRLIITYCRSKYCGMFQGEHSAILLTYIKLPFVFKAFVLYIFEWPLNTGFIVLLGCN